MFRVWIPSNVIGVGSRCGHQKLQADDHAILSWTFLAPQVPASEPQTSENILASSFRWFRKQLDKYARSHIWNSSFENPLPTSILELSDDELLRLRVLVPEKRTVEDMRTRATARAI
jgi:hypothetical protein